MIDEIIIPEGKDLYKEWKESGLRKVDIAEKYGMTYGQCAGKIWRYEQSVRGIIPSQFPIYYKKLGSPWHFQFDDFIVLADVQLPHVNETWLDLMCMISMRELRKPRRLIIAGDLLNMDVFSSYSPDHEEPSLDNEIESAIFFFEQIFHCFDEVYWFWGNHERRATRNTNGALKPYHLGKLVLGDRIHRVNLSHWGYCFVSTSQRDWIIAHGKNYSIQRLNVAEWLSWKYQKNVVSFHEHHLANGFDRYGHYQIINGGGLFEAHELSYASLDASKSPNMVNGFVMFRDGYPYVFGPDGYTNWNSWIPDNKLPSSVKMPIGVVS